MVAAVTHKSLSGKVALITGTGGGQGREAAIQFARAGAKVVGCDRHCENDAETTALVEAEGGCITLLGPADLSDSAQASRWIEEAAAIHGRIDILYNNASASKFAPFEQMSFEDWSFTLRNEIDIVFHTTHAAWKFLQQNGGVVINVGSIAGMKAGTVGCAAHAAAKGAVIALTSQLAMEGAASNIRVVAISPGFIDTPGTRFVVEDPQLSAMVLAGNLIKRPGRTDEVAAMAVFLASDAAAFITGANMVVDGGQMAF